MADSDGKTLFKRIIYNVRLWLAPHGIPAVQEDMWRVSGMATQTRGDSHIPAVHTDTRLGTWQCHTNTRPGR